MQGACISNLECGWCPFDKTCYERTKSANCSDNLQTSACPGLCPALHSCQSCVVHGRRSTAGPCSWCVEDQTCHVMERSKGQSRCGMASDTPQRQEGWWGPKGHDLVTADACRSYDLRPGLTFIRYNHPIDLKRPDMVSIINSTYKETKESNEFRGAKELQEGGMTLSRFHGFLHPLNIEPPKGTKDLKLYLSASYVNATLYLSRNHNPDSLELTASINGTKLTKVQAQRSDGSHIFPGNDEKNRYLVDLNAIQIINSTSSMPALLSLEWNAQSYDQHYIPKQHLEPFNLGGKSCSELKTCLACMTDALCGWCKVTKTCLPRNNRKVKCSLDNYHHHFLVLDSDQCEKCEDYIYCDDCVQTGDCEWLPEKAHCTRKKRFKESVRQLDDCPSPCHMRKSCTSCLGIPGRCAWCQETKV